MKLLLACILILSGMPVIPQTAIFNPFKYNEPQNWKKELRKGMVNYSDVNNSEGTFGQIAIYASRKSTIDAENEFMKDWNELISSHYSVIRIPKITISILDAFWKKAEAIVPASLNGQNFTLKMVNYTGPDSTATIIANYSGDTYKLKIDEFFLNIEIAGKNAASGTVAISTNSPVSKDHRQSYSNLIYYLPAGWEQHVKGNYLSAFPSGLKQGEVLEIRILQPINTADFIAATSESWKEISQVWKEDFYNDLFPGRIHNTALGWQYFSEKKNTRRFNGLDTEIELFLIANGSRIERCIIISDEFRIQGLDYLAGIRFFDDIYNFIFSIRLAASQDEGSVIPSLKGGSITGVWTGISGGFSGITGTYDQKTFYAVFYNNGVAYFCDRLPDRGLYQVNPLVWQNVYPDYWCTYSLSGDHGTIKSIYYHDMPIVLVGNKLTITKNGLDHSYSKLTSPDGMRFKGTWALETGESLTLNPDGSFTDNGALGIIEHSLYYKPYTVTANPGSGKYEIWDFTVIFNYSNGQKFSCSFPGFNIDRNNSSPSTLFFGRDDIFRLK